ncbi:hypothetical protein YC68_23615, partial [Vibrio parahaemolyticus]
HEFDPLTGQWWCFQKFTFWKYFGDENLMKEITVAIAVRKRSKFLQQPGHEIEKLFASSILGLGNTMVHRKTYNQ